MSASATELRTPPAAPLPRGRRIPGWEVSGYVLLLLTVIGVHWLGQRGIFVPDIKPEVYLNPWARLQLDLSTWLPDPYLGTQNYNLGLAPVDALLGVLQALGVPPEASVRVLRGALYVLAGAGAFVLVRWSGRGRPAMRLATVAVFMLNPYSVVAGSTLAILLPYAVFPWFLVALGIALSSRGWRWPALAALAFAAMSGMNVGAVPALQLVALPALIGWLLWTRRASVGTVVRGLAVTGGLALGLSLYWLIPAFAARGTAAAVVDNSETLPAISNPSSWSEVMRGLGLWPMYGGSALGPWQPGFTGYLTSTLMILASMLLLALAVLGVALSRSRVRVLVVALLMTVGAVMVGLHPYTAPSPLGALMGRAFEAVPSLLVVRTTNKAGAGVALALALAIGLLVDSVARARLTSGVRASAMFGVALVWLLSIQPFVVGEAFVGRWKLPDYWREASADLNQAGAGRLWLVPGQVLAGYRWSTDSVDDVNVSLLDQRSTVVRTQLPTQNPESSNLLYNQDNALQTFTTPPGSIAHYARLMGATQILLRSDVNWNASGGLPAGLVDRQVREDKGLTPVRTYGQPGENTRDPRNPNEEIEPTLHPLALFDVTDPRPAVRASAIDATVVLAGDAAGIVSSDLAGLVPPGAAVVYAQSLRDDQWAELSGPRHRWVLTDSNRRTNVGGSRLQSSTSVLLPASVPTTSTRALGTARDQTTAIFSSVAEVWATNYSLDGLGVAGNPTLAVDGNTSTAWVISVLGELPSETLTVNLGEPRPLGRVTVTTVASPGLQVAELRVTFAGQTRRVPVPAGGVVTLDFDRATGSELTLSISRVTGTGPGAVGISDVSWGEGAITPGARVPLSLDAAVTRGGLTADQVSSTPVDVVLSRATSQEWFGAQEERSLLRDFTLPSASVYRAYGIAVVPEGSSVPTPGTDGCVRAGTLDGRVLRVKSVEARAPVVGRPWLFASCDPISLAAGPHRLESSSPVLVNSVTLRDSRGENPIATLAAPPEVRILEQTPTLLRAEVTNSSGLPYWFSSGTSVDAGWRATVNGADLGAPTPLDGYSMSWRVDAPGTSVIEVAFAPQGTAVAARWASLAALLLTVLLIVIGRRRERPDLRPGPLWRPTPVVTAIALVAWCGLTQGAVGAIIGVVAAAVVLSGLVRPSRWLGAAVLAAVLSPFAWIVANNALIGMVSSELVLRASLSSWLAWLAITLMAVGVATTRPTPRARS